MAAPGMTWPFAGDRRSLIPETASISTQDTSSTSPQVVGTTNLFENGQIRLIPMPSADPNDPLNMPRWRKWTSISVTCFFGALALSAEIIIGSLLPVFIIEYAGLDPTVILTSDLNLSSPGGATSVNALSVLPPNVLPPNLQNIALLATIPLLTNGIASYLLVPLSIAIGRRPIMLIAGLAAWTGSLWASLSASLVSHIAARALQGLGAGAVEALIPLVIQDITFIHQRNRAMSAIVASQGIFIVAFGAVAPYVAANYDWRWLYYATAGFGFLAWLLLIVFLPETRWIRGLEALVGHGTTPLPQGATRPALDTLNYKPRTFWQEMLPYGQNGIEWRLAGKSMLDTLRTTFFPAVLWSVLANSIFIIANQACAQLGSFALLADGWDFQYTGLSVIPFVAATVMVYIFGGPVADVVANSIARWNGGEREPEHHLANLVFPFVCGVVGSFVFGWAGEEVAHWGILLTGAFLVVFGFLTTMTVLNVFIVECYPMLAGPVLVNVSSLRIIIAFFFASQATVWVAERGMLATFAIYADVMIVLSLGIPLFYFFGKKMRMLTAGKVRGGKMKGGSKKVKEKESDVGSSIGR